MEVICYYGEWGIVRANGMLYSIDMSDGVSFPVKEVYRIPADKTPLYSDAELENGADFDEQFDFSGEDDTGDYVYWAATSACMRVCSYE